MGSDMSMEAQSFRSKGTRARWDEDYLVVERDVFYHGWTEIWRGRPDFEDETTMSLLNALVSLDKIPEKPVPFHASVDKVLVDFLNDLFGVNLDKIPEKPIPFHVRVEKVLVDFNNARIGLTEAVEQLNEIYKGAYDA